jgi:thiosulfate reductase cytochrome b subunit
MSSLKAVARDIATAPSTWICVVVTLITTFVALPTSFNHVFVGFAIVLNIIGYVVSHLEARIRYRRKLAGKLTGSRR